MCVLHIDFLIMCIKVKFVVTQATVGLDRPDSVALAILGRGAPVVDLDGARGFDDVGYVATAVHLCFVQFIKRQVQK